MRHDLKVLASDFGLNEKDFTRFALLPDNRSKFDINDEEGFVTTSEFHVNRLVEDFRTFMDNHRNLSKIKSLDHTISVIKNKYYAEKADADWFNNNMPNVGQTVEYRIVPPYPKDVIEELEKLRENLIFE